VIIIVKIPVGQSQPTVRQNVSAAVGTLEKKKKKEASTIHPHHCSKILFQNEDSHSKNFRVIIIIKIPVGQSQPTVRQSVSAAVGTLETKKRSFDDSSSSLQ
jgi:hypothetical protein